jgi:hypothetical protein
MTLKIELDLRPLKLGVGKAMNYWMINAKEICPKDTHAMKNSIKVRVETLENGFSGIIGTLNNLLRKAKNFHYPFAVHDGAKAFVMTPKTGNFLHFKTKTGWVKTKKVNMPARKARPFFLWSYENMRDKMNNAILDGVRLK